MLLVKVDNFSNKICQPRSRQNILYMKRQQSRKNITRRMAIANGTCVSFCNQPKSHFDLPWVCPWYNSGNGKCHMDEKRIQCLSNASQHVPIYLQPFPSNSSRKFKSSPFYVLHYILRAIAKY